MINKFNNIEIKFKELSIEYDLNRIPQKSQLKILSFIERKLNQQITLEAIEILCK